MFTLHCSGERLAQIRALIAEKKQQLQQKGGLEKSRPEAVFKTACKLTIIVRVDGSNKTRLSHPSRL